MSIGRRAIDVANIEGWIELTQVNGWDDMRVAHVYLYGSGALRVPWQENDWITNFAVCPAAGVVHLGYLVAAIRVLRDIREDIRGCRYVNIAGHSLGGAVAEIAGVLLAAAKRGSAASPIVFIDNFGGPAPLRRGVGSVIARGMRRIGRAAWYVAGNDVVPYLMPWNRHVGHRIHLHSDSRNPVQNHIHGYDECIEEYR